MTIDMNATIARQLDDHHAGAVLPIAQRRPLRHDLHRHKGRCRRCHRYQRQLAAPGQLPPRVKKTCRDPVATRDLRRRGARPKRLGHQRQLLLALFGTLIGVAGLGSTLISAFLLPRLLPALAVSVVRDWLPAALVLFVYWQAGEFFMKVDQRFQDCLERIDARMAAPLLHWLARSYLGNWIAAYLELAYLLCYPMIPMSIGTLYLLRLARYADSFWIVVLVSTYLSYGVLPFLQTLPPRMLAEPWLEPLVLMRTWSRSGNCGTSTVRV
jgi:hypothetical protein